MHRWILPSPRTGRGRHRLGNYSAVARSARASGTGQLVAPPHTPQPMASRSRNPGWNVDIRTGLEALPGRDVEPSGLPVRRRRLVRLLDRTAVLRWPDDPSRRAAGDTAAVRARRPGPAALTATSSSATTAVTATTTSTTNARSPRSARDGDAATLHLDPRIGHHPRHARVDTGPACRGLHSRRCRARRHGGAAGPGR